MLRRNGKEAESSGKHQVAMRAFPADNCKIMVEKISMFCVTVSTEKDGREVESSRNS